MGHWLGDGVYFYETCDDVRGYKGEDIVAIKATIKVEEERFLDFSSPQGIQVCESIASTIENITSNTIRRNRVEEVRKELAQNIHETNSRDNFDVFRGPYYRDHPTLKDDNLKDKWLEHEVHILVRKLSCITYFEPVNE
ncbi:hypothetical protein [Clostridium butyricum]|uniref:hypothetical protein n=1 Tax=Clostridium butyricum TaxID=1492 RepID=UPI001267C6C1|nr:hypothetical protein [Clostridium butyricum]